MVRANSVESRVEREAYAPSHPVDLAHLRRYTMGDRALELEILGLFAGQMPLTVGALKNAPSPKEWAIAAHTLKGSARAVGAWTVAAIAESAERLKPDDENGRDLVVQRLEEAADEAHAYIVSLGDAA